MFTFDETRARLAIIWGDEWWLHRHTEPTNTQATTHAYRCRLYRVGDGLTPSAQLDGGQFVRMWDFEDIPITTDLPKGELRQTFTGKTRFEVRTAVERYCLKHNIRSCTNWNG